MPLKLSRNLAAIALAALCACHQQSPGSPGSVSHDVITQDEIDALGSTASIYDVIVRLRGDYLTDRGRTSIRTNTTSRAVVFMDDQYYGIPETMRNIPSNRVGMVRHWSGIDAVSRFGASYGGGVIQLTPRLD